MEIEPTKKSLKRIILLEDEIHLGEFYKKHLSKIGYDVLWYKSSEDLIRDHENHTFHLALIDQSLESEGKTGIELIPMLKAHHPKMKIIMLSNYSQFELEKKARDAGADDYLLKIDNPPRNIGIYIDEILS